MAKLSIILPNNIAKACQETAAQLGISRTQFIHLAISHELESFQAKLEREEMIKSFSAMKKSKRYLKEAEEIISGLDLPFK